MELSTFELLVKRIAPLNGNPVVEDVARRAIQGYFLTISNLEPVDLVFQLEFFISRPDPVDPDRTLDGNVDVYFDVAGANQELFLYGDASTTRFSTSFKLPARQTASVQLLPKAQLFGNPNPDFEVRGYVVLSLPAIFDLNNFSFKAQNKSDVKVLVNPEMRGTFLPNTFPVVLGGDYDQMVYPLTVASGKGLNEVKAEPNSLLGVVPLTPAVRDTLRQELLNKLATAVTEVGKTQALVELGDLVKNNPVVTPQNFSDIVNNQLIVPAI